MASWQWTEIETIWRYPDWTAQELHELIPTHSVQAIRKQRVRMGRWNSNQVPICCMCEERPVWVESAQAKRYGLCKSCYLDEERMRLEDEAKAAAIRQRRRKQKRNHGEG